MRNYLEVVTAIQFPRRCTRCLVKQNWRRGCGRLLKLSGGYGRANGFVAVSRKSGRSYVRPAKAGSSSCRVLVYRHAGPSSPSTIPLQVNDARTAAVIMLVEFPSLRSCPGFAISQNIE